MDAAICVQTDSAINACEALAGPDSYPQQVVIMDIDRGSAFVVQFNRASKRSGNEAADLTSTEASFLVWALRKNGAGATSEEIGWTPIRLRRWLRVKLKMPRYWNLGGRFSLNAAIPS